MRVRLSYTAEIDEVLSEAAFLMGNLASTFQESIKLYDETTRGLKEKEFNPNKFHENIDILRENLNKIDTRCLEVDQVVAGFQNYQRQEREPAPQDTPREEVSSPSASTTENEATDD